MTSNVIKPIIKQLKVANFANNTKLDAFFKPGEKKSVNSIEDLMKIIDAQCSFGDTSCKISFSAMQQKKLNNNFINLWQSGKYSDFRIILNGAKEFRVYKFILTAQSETFAEIFENNENVSEMQIEDLSESGVAEFLRYLYTGDFTCNDKIAMEMFALATRLKVGEMKIIAEGIIMDKLTYLNALKIFTFAHSYKLDEIKRASFKEIQKVFPDIKLADNLINDFQGVKELLEAKKKMDAMTEILKK